MNIPELIAASKLSSVDLSKKFGGTQLIWSAWKGGDKPQQAASYKRLNELRQYCIDNKLIPESSVEIIKHKKSKLDRLSAQEFQTFRKLISSPQRAAISRKYKIPSSTACGWVSGKVPKRKSTVETVRAILADKDFTATPAAEKHENPSAKDSKTLNFNALLISVNAGQIAIMERLDKLIQQQIDANKFLSIIASSTHELSQKL